MLRLSINPSDPPISANPIFANYDDGYFDKDEQGWCARCHQISEAGGIITVRQWGDDNGLRPYDETAQYTNGGLVPGLSLLRLTNREGHTAAYFDTATSRLVSAIGQDSLSFLPPPGYTTPAALPTAIDEHGNAEGCTYAGLHGPLEPLFADLPQPWVAMNDAVLTARGYPGESTLVLTIGFGVGIGSLIVSFSF